MHYQTDYPLSLWYTFYDSFFLRNCATYRLNFLPSASQWKGCWCKRPCIFVINLCFGGLHSVLWPRVSHTCIFHAFKGDMHASLQKINLQSSDWWPKCRVCCTNYLFCAINKLQLINFIFFFLSRQHQLTRTAYSRVNAFAPESKLPSLPPGTWPWINVLSTLQCLQYLCWNERFITHENS